MPLLNSEFLSLEEAIKEFNVEKDVKTSVKTPEELDRLTVDETLNDVDRAVHIFSSGQEVQCISAIYSLPHLLQNWQSESVQKVIPKLTYLLKNAGIDVQLVAAEIFTTIARKSIFPVVAFTKYFLKTALQNINLKDPVAAQAWIDCVIATIPCLTRDIIQKEILGMILARGHFLQPSSHRISCCKMLGAAVSKFDLYSLKKDILPTVKQLCQDTDFYVRFSMCEHLHLVAEALGAEETRHTLLGDILELAGDEEKQVQGAALDCLTKIAALLDKNFITNNVVPLMFDYCDSAVGRLENHLVKVAENFGHFCHVLSAFFTCEQRARVFDLYRQLCTVGRQKIANLRGEHADVVCTSANLEIVNSASKKWKSEERYEVCRKHCAYNFPAVLSFCGAASFKTNLFSCLSLLCTDPYFVVRQHTASGMYEVARILDVHANLIQPHVVHLLRETESPAVLQSLFDVLPNTLLIIVIQGNLIESKTSGVADICNALLFAISKLEQQWTLQWRPLAKISLSLGEISRVFTQEQIYHKLIPFAFKLLTLNAYFPVRAGAASSVCTLLHSTRSHEHRIDIGNRLVGELCCSKRFRNRIMFFTVCDHLIKLFSRAYFKEHFFCHLLHLFDDPVPNVRMCLYRMLPRLKSMLQLPRDRILHGQLEANVRKVLASESDRDALMAMHQAIFKMDQVKVKVETVAHPVIIDVDDNLKEEDERSLELEVNNVHRPGPSSRTDGHEVKRVHRRSVSMHSSLTLKAKHTKDTAKSFSSGQQPTVYSNDTKDDKSSKHDPTTPRAIKVAASKSSNFHTFLPSFEKKPRRQVSGPSSPPAAHKSNTAPSSPNSKVRAGKKSPSEAKFGKTSPKR